MKKNFMVLLGVVLSIGLSFSQTQNPLSENGGTKNYKITFPDIDQFQLKEMVPVCSEIFDATAGNLGETNVLYFDSNVNLTKEQLKTLLENRNIHHEVELEILSQ